jgi:tetratricopeptide (TPR) repeat protein
MEGPFSRAARAFTRRLTYVACAGLWLGVGPGCTLLQRTQTVAEVPTDPPIKDETNQPRRTPQAGTCVVLAGVRLQLAEQPTTTPLQQQRLYDEALRCYQQALRTDPKSVAAYLGAARLYDKMDQHDRAMETLHDGVAHCPNEASLWFEMGMMQARRKEWDPALNNLHKASELDPTNHLYANVTGYCLARAGHYDESYTYLAKVQGQAKAHYSVARMLYQMRRDQECKAHLQMALEAKPDFAPARQLLAEMDKPPEDRAIIQASHEESVGAAPQKPAAKPTAKSGDNDWD